MSIPYSIRNRCKFLSDQLRLNIPLEEQQRLLLSKVLDAISEGEDPSIVFGEIKSKGKREIDELTQERIKLVLQRISSDIFISKKKGNQIKIATVIRNHLDFANELWGYNPSMPVITESQIRRWWDNKKYRSFRSPVIESL